MQPGVTLVKETAGSKLIVAVVAEQAKLRRIPRGLGKAEMAEGMRGQQTTARGALQIAALDQIGSMMSSMASRGSTAPPPSSPRRRDRRHMD